MDARMTARPQLAWVEVPDGHGGTRLEMRWSMPDAGVAPSAA